MKYRLKKFSKRLQGTVTLESSKSESNRALIIAALAGGADTSLYNVAKARDTVTMQSLLKETCSVLDVKDAGTTMRFLTAYLVVNGQNQTLTGTERMKNRPIGPLVEALRQIGAKIEYKEKEGYPPIEVHRLQEQKGEVIQIPGNISSQYISALLMIAPYLEEGLTIVLTTEIFSRPYIQLTLDLMQKFGVEVTWEENKLTVVPQKYKAVKHYIEGDWSGASYWYAFMALSRNGYLFLPNIWSYSSQGDHKIAEIMYKMGVATHFENGKAKLIKNDDKQSHLTIDFRECPDLAQTVMATAAVSGITLEMTGLESLKIKETDRVAAMQNEVAKLGASLTEKSGKYWTLVPSSDLPSAIEVDTYEDHRMAMAFAPLCRIMDVTIDDPKVVEKSYPAFWTELEKCGVEIEKIS